jgi:hypothetical protein
VDIDGSICIKTWTCASSIGPDNIRRRAIVPFDGFGEDTDALGGDGEVGGDGEETLLIAVFGTSLRYRMSISLLESFNSYLGMLHCLVQPLLVPCDQHDIRAFFRTRSGQ